MLEACHVSPAPALQLSSDAGIWEANPAALSWGVTAGWSVAVWFDLVERIRATQEHGDGRGEAKALGVCWHAVSLDDRELIAWLTALPADTSAELRLHEAERRAALATEMGGFGVWQIDLSTGRRHWDAQMFRLRGLDPATHADPTEALRLSALPERFQKLQKRLVRLCELARDGAVTEADIPFEGGYPINWPDGGRRWLHTRVKPLYEDGRITRLIGLDWDITEQKEAEELRRQHAAAEAANEAKSRFLANMSHDIRTPMNAILGMSHLVLRTGLDVRQRNYVGKIERSAKTLLGLINDILDFSKIEADRLEFERVGFRLADVLDDLASVVGLQVEEKRLELVFALAPALPTRLIGDPLRLGQVLINLVNNAIKFTDRGEVVLRIDALPAPPGRDAGAVLRFSVTDTGRSMTPEQLERLFEPFRQAQTSTARVFGGTGLGLAISRRLIDAMGGQIEVTSTPGQGSCFAFSVGFGVPADAAGIADIAAPTARRALVVDDNANAREALIEMCRRLGVTAEGATDAFDALRAVSAATTGAQPFDLVLLDADMPGMDGVGCAQQLLARTPQAAVVLLSGTFGRDRVMQQLADAGLSACPVLVKPVLPSSLHDSVATACGLRPAAERRRGQRSSAAEQARRRLRGARVLLVDDHEINQELARELLGDAGLIVSVADHGGHAIELLQQHEFDIVLMDCQMPVMDGYEATERIRREPRWAALPIIAMTANVMAGDQERALASGMNDHIAKPIEIEAMFATLARWVAPRAGAA